MQNIEDTQSKKAQTQFIRTAMQAPVLEKDHELALATLWRDKKDQRALNELIQSYLRLVVAIAARFKHYGLANSDLIQEGTLGLLKAADRFEPARELRFSTYASWWIRSYIQDFVLRNWSIVRTGTTASQKSLFFNLRRIQGLLERKVDTKIDETVSEAVAKALGVPLNEVQEMSARLGGGDQSLNITVGEDGDSELQDFVADAAASPEAMVIELTDQRRQQKLIAQAMDSLSPREQQIIAARRLTEDGITLEALGAKMGVSKERVRQLEQRAMEKMRTALNRLVKNPSDLFAEAA